jgi:nucleotide-binding universal stress UspA family protein
LKTILVYVNGTAGDLSVLATALQVGRLFNAHLDCLHVVPDRRSLIARTTNVDLTAAMTLPDAFRALEREAAKRVAHARQIFFAVCEDKHIPHLEAPRNSLSVSAAWHEHTANPVAVLIEEARFHDLVALEGGARRDLILSADDVGRLIVSAGRPVLLVPSVIHGGSLKSIAIAWKDSPEAARAVTAAMPLLERAENIVVLHADEESKKAGAEKDGLDRLADLLRRHGLRVAGRHVVPGRLTIPDAVVGKAIESGAGLLVMGGFGHSRLREFVFGGFTQRVVDAAELPVLLFH